MVAWNRLTTAGLSLALIALLAVLARLATDAAGGPLDPAGPPASTSSVVEPRTAITQPASADGFPIVIDQPGSYYLASNIVGVATKNGIEITANHVSIDLNGFRLQGVSPTQFGLVVSGTRAGIRIHNGAIGGWGVGIQAPDVQAGRYHDLQITDNASAGIRATGASFIHDVTVRDSTTGIELVSGSSGTGLIIDSVINASAFPLEIEDQDIVIRRTVIGQTGQLVNHQSAALWLDDNQLWGGNFGYVIDGNSAVVTRNTLIQNVSFAGTGINNHVGSFATVGEGTVSSTNVWSNVRY